MKVRLLGTSAGGGLPQWNCNCRVCQATRRDPSKVKPRSQSSVAVSADGERWFLLNVSPDIRFQIEAFPPLRATRNARGSAVEGALLTNADLDHTLGLLLIREGERLAIHSSDRVRASLEKGFRAPSLLEKYSGADWREPAFDEAQPLRTRAGEPSGLRCQAFAVPGKVPRYLEGLDSGGRTDNLGYRLIDERTGGRLVFIPDCGRLDAGVRAQMAACEVLLFDGTFWSESEMAELGGRLAAAMAHQPVGGAQGTLAELAGLRCRRIYLHINNTNPMLLSDSPERAAVVAAGVEIGVDGQELEL
jgi:pyrroloquinoline quinone biosynthesis protein B